MAILHNYNREKRSPIRGRKIDGFSITIPDQSLSIREIYERYNQGIPLDLQEMRGVFDNLTLDDFDLMDMKDVLSPADLYNRMSDVQKRAHIEKWFNADGTKKEPTQEPTQEPTKEPNIVSPDVSHI